MKKVTVTVYAASLRNARSLEGGVALVKDIMGCSAQDELVEYLAGQGNIHLERFYEAGRGQGVPFDQLYKKLKQSKGMDGLSNSEVCAAAALWGAKEIGADIRLVPFTHHFLADGSVNDTQGLRESILESDGLIVSSPVYFGDRSSLSQRFLDFVRSDRELCAGFDKLVYGGTTVGAKRNGGQETALIYQMYDMMEVGALGVGNDHLTTSQYGGTGHAGDVATMPADEYGIKTSIGTGRRVARVASMLKFNDEYRLEGKVKVGFWVLQERGEQLMRFLAPILEEFSDEAEFVPIRIDNEQILPCLACDLCPSRVGDDDEYRCVRGKSDGLCALHGQVLDCDMVLAAALSPRERTGLKSSYQAFLERTRHVRRSDYSLTNRLITPLVLSELGSNENLNLRMVTSLIRHHTVMHRPLIGHYQGDALLNPDDVRMGIQSALRRARRLAVGRMASTALGEDLVIYQPTGYVLSACKSQDVKDISRRKGVLDRRVKHAQEEFGRRTSPRG